MINPIRSSVNFIYNSSLRAIEFLNKNIVSRVTNIFSSVVGKTSQIFSKSQEKDYIITFNKKAETVKIEIFPNYKKLFDRIS